MIIHYERNCDVYMDQTSIATVKNINKMVRHSIE